MPFPYFRDLSVLFVGDLIVFSGSLWLALVARHFVAPNIYQYAEHLVPFSVLFLLWCVVFVIVGLYDRSVALFEHQLPATVFYAQVVNMALAVLFFFIAPIAIQPKTILALYFVISTSLIVVWRLGIFRLRSHGRGAEAAVFVGMGPDMDELVAEVKRSPHTRLECVEYVSVMPLNTPHTLVVDPRLRTQLSLQQDVVDASELYEALFGRVALSMLDREAFVTTSFSRENKIADIVKRMMDIVLSVVFGAVSLVAYPFVYAAIRADDDGPLFVAQTRVGKDGRLFTMYKFRSMSGNDSGQYGVSGKTTLTVTRVGRFLRSSRIDELPQLWSVLRGDQSLVGPRPELPPLVERYQAELPNYDLRHLVVPGLSGWAQIYHQAHPHHAANVDETARKLSYDLYYIKHRSLILDLDITLKTIKALVLRLGA